MWQQHIGYTSTFLLAVVAGCYPGHTVRVAETLPHPVEVIEVHASPVPDPLSLVGRIEPWREAVLYFEVPGTVAEVYVEAGEDVQAGAPIAQLDLTDYRLAVSRATAERDAAVAQWRLFEAGTRKEDLEAAHADLDRARALVTFWQGEFQRSKKIYDKRSISLSDFERTQRQYDAALQDQRATKARLDRAIAGPRQEELAAAAAKAEAQRQALAIAQRQLDKATLKAPFAGRVEQRLLDPGAYVNVFPTGGVPVVHLIDLSKADCVIAVPEADRARFRVGEAIDLVAAVRHDLRITGRAIALGQVADRASGTFDLRVRFPNDGRRFLGGMVVTAVRHNMVRRSAIRIPLTAVRHAYGQTPYVLLVAPGTNRAVHRDVVLGAIDGNHIEVTRGIADGDLLIVRGQQSVVAGDPVRYHQLERAAVPKHPVSTTGTPANP